LIGFELLSDGLAFAFRENSLEMENSWAIELCEELTLEFEEKDPLDEHGNFILKTPQEPCSQNPFLESAVLYAASVHEDYNHPKILPCEMFSRMVVDAYDYHKHCKFHGCVVSLTLHLER
jgi:hypothetical protein